MHHEENTFQGSCHYLGLVCRISSLGCPILDLYFHKTHFRCFLRTKSCRIDTFLFRQLPETHHIWHIPLCRWFGADLFEECCLKRRFGASCRFQARILWTSRQSLLDTLPTFVQSFARMDGNVSEPQSTHLHLWFGHSTRLWPLDHLGWFYKCHCDSLQGFSAAGSFSLYIKQKKHNMKLSQI